MLLTIVFPDFIYLFHLAGLNILSQQNPILYDYHLLLHIHLCIANVDFVICRESKFRENKKLADRANDMSVNNNLRFVIFHYLIISSKLFLPHRIRVPAPSYQTTSKHHTKTKVDGECLEHYCTDTSGNGYRADLGNQTRLCGISLRRKVFYKTPICRKAVTTIVAPI